MLAALACARPGSDAPASARPGYAYGVVFHDRDGNGTQGRFEPGLAGVAVSNGREVTRTDRRGGYQLPVGRDTIVFVVKPRGYAPPLDAYGRSRFYYVHKPDGSARHLRFAGSAPTGPLPDSIDFPLHRSRESDRFRMLLLGDPQPRNLEDLDFLARDVVSQLVGSDVQHALVLGDLVNDDLDLFEPLSALLGHIGVPWYPVLGNHDINFLAHDDAGSDETFQRTFGPATYAFQIARVHFVVLDDILYRGWDAERGRRGGYEIGFDADGLSFLRAYLAEVPASDLVVIAMHAPLAGPGERRAEKLDELLELLSMHPRTLSISAHTHMQYQRFLPLGDGRVHHHINQAAACGSWWLGTADESGLPHATQRDGSPNGWSIVHFDGTDYRVEFQPARRPASHQMQLIAPSRIRAEDARRTEVLVNVFAGSERSRVELRANDGEWREMTRVERADPLYVQLYEREMQRPPEREFPLPAPAVTNHLWAATLPEDLPRGRVMLEVRETDLYGQVHSAHHLLRVE